MAEESSLRKPILGALLTSESTYVPVMINDTGTNYELTINYDYDRAEIQDQWIANALKKISGLPLNIAPNPRINSTTIMPEVLHVIAEGKPLALIDCMILPGSIHDPYSQADTIRIRPRIISHISPDEKIERISILRSVIPGLLTWSGSYSLTQSWNDTEQGREYSVTLHSSKPIVLDAERGLSLIPDAEANSSIFSESPSKISQYVEFESKSAEPKDWDYHLKLHHTMKALISLARYEPLIFTRMSASPQHERGIWHEVYSHNPEIDPSFTVHQYPFSFFNLEDIGPEGVKKWFDLNRQCPDGINGLNYLIENSRHIALEAHYLMMSIAFEKIGYYLTKDDNLHYAEYLQSVIDDINKANSGQYFPLPDKEQWKTETQAIYYDIKHAGKRHQHPEPNRMFEYLSEGILVLRVWVARRLGCNMDKLFSKLNTDYQVRSCGIKILSKQKV